MNFNQNTKLCIHENASINIVCEMAAILSVNLLWYGCLSPFTIFFPQVTWGGLSQWKKLLHKSYLSLVDMILMGYRLGYISWQCNELQQKQQRYRPKLWESFYFIYRKVEYNQTIGFTLTPFVTQHLKMSVTWVHFIQASMCWEWVENDHRITINVMYFSSM